MGEIYKCNGAKEALELAQALKREGKYDYFRGQRKNWPVVSTLLRDGKEYVDSKIKALGRFNGWIKNTPGLESIAGNDDKVLAVAQHYGLPTNFVDFTTSPKVATYFATENASDGDDSVIICLSRTDLEEFWKQLRFSPNEYPAPELLVMGVDNLWRLEAQAGVFLYLPYIDFERTIYDFDRIVFPATTGGYVSAREMIYPVRKSGLEILLDKYFMSEKGREGFRQIAETTKLRIVELKTKLDGGWEELLIDGKLPPRHPSWEANEEEWFGVSAELFSNAVVNVPTLKLPKWSDERESYVSSVKSAFQKDASVRGRACLWEAPWCTRDELVGHVHRLWDGMRMLPYSDDEIAESIGVLVELFIRADPVNGHDKYRRAAFDVFPDAREISLGDLHGYSRCIVSTGMLLSGLRQDIDEFVDSRGGLRASLSVTRALQAIHSPVYGFSFDRFRSMFVREVIPTQVLLRSAGLAVFFNPYRVKYFGLP